MKKQAKAVNEELVKDIFFNYPNLEKPAFLDIYNNPLKKFTKKQRLEIYQEMLKNIDEVKYNKSGLCSLLLLTCYRNYNINHYTASVYTNEFMRRFFPELYEKKPKKSNYGVYWYKPGTIAPRKKLLTKIIKEMNEKK